MKVTANVKLNLKIPEAMAMVNQSTREGIRDTVVEITNDTVQPPPTGSPYQTGHNRRSMTADVSGMGGVHRGADSQPERVVDERKNEGAVYSTSGYGGFLETGTATMTARPYIKPAYDRRIGSLPNNIKRHLEAKGG